MEHEIYLFAAAGRRVEVQICAQEISKRPAPFWALVIVSTLSNGRVLRVVRIIVVPPVLCIRWIQCLHSERRAEDTVRQTESAEGMLWIKEFGGNSHRYREVASELII